MDKIYRIGSFNLHNIGIGAFSNSRDLEKIADIIKQERLDVVAFQEVLSEGKVFTKEDLPSSITKNNIIAYLGGKEHWDFEWADSGDESNRHEGYAFLWNKDRLRLSTAEISLNGKRYERTYYPRMIKINRQEMRRQPYFARFTPQGLPGGSGFEIRLLCVHTYFGSDNANDRQIRQNELDVLMTEVYPRVADQIFYNGLTQYTILLGDYNAELVTDDNREAVRRHNEARKAENVKIPAVLRTDGEGKVHSYRYNVDVKTVQDQPTTLKKVEAAESDTGKESFGGRGYASNYDHFSYDEAAIGHVIHNLPRRVDAVNDYFQQDYEKYFNTISDHVPIVMELKIN